MPFEVNIHQDGPFPSIQLLHRQKQVSAEVYAFGALLNAYTVVKNGQAIQCIDAFPSKEYALSEIKSGFKSAKMSPFACRLKHGQYKYGNEQYQVKKFFLGKHAIHGLLYDALFEIDDISATDEGAKVELSYHYEGQEEGYPWPFDMQVTYLLNEAGALEITTAVSHNQPGAIPIMDGWHPYFQLGEFVDDCSLQIFSERRVDMDAEIIPTGHMVADNRFLEPKLLEGVVLDDCFQLQSRSDKLACVLKNQNWSFRIYSITNYPYLQVYTPDSRRSIAIECLSAPPDAFNHTQGLIELEPHVQQTFKAIYHLE